MFKKQMLEAMDWGGGRGAGDPAEILSLWDKELSNGAAVLLGGTIGAGGWGGGSASGRVGAEDAAVE